MTHPKRMTFEKRADSAPTRTRRGLSPTRHSCIMRVSFLTVFILCFSPTATRAIGPCSYEWVSLESGNVLLGTVHSLMVWDPDDAGPEAPLLIARGIVQLDGPSALPEPVVAWNGSDWIQMAEGLEPAYSDISILDLATFEGRLVACGSFATGASWNEPLRVWSGESWGLLGPNLIGDAFALAIFDGDLIAGGELSTDGWNTSASLMRWNGAAWQPFGQGDPNTPAFVLRLVPYRGLLFAWAYFSNGPGTYLAGFAYWDGESWHRLPPGDVSFSVLSALTVIDGALIAAGDLVAIDGNASCGITRWDGAGWQLYGERIPRPSVVKSVKAYQGELIAAGWFLDPTDGTRHGMIKWNGSEWIPYHAEFEQGVNDFAEYRGRLVLGGGTFSSEDTFAYCVAQRDGDSWEPLQPGFNVAPTALAVYRGEVVARGQFTHVGGNRVNSIARLHAGTWLPIGGGFTDDTAPGSHRNTPLTPRVNALTVYDDLLIAGGRFISADGTPVDNIAAWDGEAWKPLGPGLSGEVRALCIHDSELIAAGEFDFAGDFEVNRIARWDGDTWHPIGSGFDVGRVESLVVYNGALVAGGSISMADGKPIDSVASWTGDAWCNMGGDFGIDVHRLNRLHVSDQSLFMAGQFHVPGAPMACFGEWTGVEWKPLAAGLSTRHSFHAGLAMCTFDGLLVGAGHFENEGEKTLKNIAAWDGKAWRPLGGGTDQRVSALTVCNGELYAGGSFWFVDGNYQTGLRSHYIARWAPACQPGDMNCNLTIDPDDVEPFVAVLLDPGNASDCASYLSNITGDANEDGTPLVNANDIAVFVARLTGM